MEVDFPKLIGRGMPGDGRKLLRVPEVSPGLSSLYKGSNIQIVTLLEEMRVPGEEQGEPPVWVLTTLRQQARFQGTAASAGEIPSTPAQAPWAACLSSKVNSCLTSVPSHASMWGQARCVPAAQTFPGCRLVLLLLLLLPQGLDFGLILISQGLPLLPVVL